MKLRSLACGALCLVATLVPVAPAGGKEGMTATLLGHVPVDAWAGTTVRIAWRIGERSATAAGRDDDRFYVRLYSASGFGSRRAFGHLVGRHYVARVRVPAGGIGDIKIFLVGWRGYPGGASERADMEIPLANDPLP